MVSSSLSEVGPVDVRSGAGLRRALAEVARAPGGWESGLGVVVAEAVGAELWRRVGRGQREDMAARCSGVGELVLMLRAEVLDLLMLRPGEVAAAGDGELWAWLVRRAVWAVGEAAVVEGLHGLSGDTNVGRLRSKASAAGLVVGSLEEADPGAVDRAQPIVPAGGGGEPVVVGLGPVLSRLVVVLVESGVPETVASAGTVRVAEIAVATRVRARHTRAREDAREGVLGGLGVSEAAAGAWMSLLVGSKRQGAGSSLVLALRSGVADTAGGGWSELQRQWVERVARGVGAGAAPAARQDAAGAQGPAQLELELGQQLAAEVVMGRVA